MSLALAIFAEFFCSALLVLGLFTRWASIPLIITMGVAVFDIHIDDGFAVMEKALLYLTAYLSILILGPGKLSLDRVFNR